jgi:uncharacterized coiled-coil protein SlyX
MWYDRAYEELEKMLEDGDISQEEFRKELRYLQDEIEDCRQQAAEEAYNNY